MLIGLALAVAWVWHMSHLIAGIFVFRHIQKRRASAQGLGGFPGLAHKYERQMLHLHQEMRLDGFVIIALTFANFVFWKAALYGS